MSESDLVAASTTRRILSAALEVHRHLGPGLLESAYRECLVKQLTDDRMKVEREVPISINYKTLCVPGAFRADVVVDDSVLIELKAVERVLPVHEAQTLTYLRLSKLKVGLLLNFNSHLREGIHRFIG